MNFLKAFISWKLWLAILLGVGLIVGLWFFSFKYLDQYTQHGVEVEVPNISGLTVQEAMKLLEEKNLNYEIDSVKYTEAYPPFTIIDFYPKEGSKVKPGRRVFIKSNPSTWAPVELPKLINKSKRLALTQLNMKGFKLGDTIYVKDAARDAVLAVLFKGDTIKSGTLLPKGATLDLVLGRGLNFDVPVPNLLGLTLNEAKRMIKENYFEIGQVYFLDNRDTLANTVIYQDPPERDIYDEGLPISLWLSDKPRSENKKIIDSLNIVFRHAMKDDDSVFYKSVESSKKININDLPEEIRNQVKNERQTAPRSEKRTQPNTTPKIDTTGISID
ncbi:MAG: PASTA domain-containing protein [Weeksellaceae bacterium]